VLLKYCKDSAATPEAAAFVYIFPGPVFASRLPDPKRKDIDKILKKYNMSEYDQFTLLKKCQGRLPKAAVGSSPRSSCGNDDCSVRGFLFENTVFLSIDYFTFS